MFYVSCTLDAPGSRSFEHALQRLFVESSFEGASSACNLLALPTYSISGVAQCSFAEELLELPVLPGQIWALVT